MISLTGNIKDAPLPEIFAELASQKATGTLIIRTKDALKSVYLQNGQIIFASSTQPEFRLGEILVRTGKLKREDLESALQTLNKTAGFKKLGALLVEQGYVSPRDLFSALKTQVKDIIYSLFLQNDASYSFEEALSPDAIHLQLDIAELIREIIERIKQES